MHTTLHPTPKTICLGPDIAKAKLDACLLHSGTRHRAQFDNTPAGLRALLAWRNKTDTLGAEVIAHYGLTHDPDLWQPASPAQAALRTLLRRLAALGELAQIEARRAETSEAVVGKSIARLQKHIARETAAIEAAIAEHLAANAALHADCERLCAIPGIGLKTARWLVAELPRHLPTAALPPRGAASPRASARAAAACAARAASGARATASCAKSSTCPPASHAAPTPPQSLRRLPRSPRQIQNVRPPRRRTQAPAPRLRTPQTPVRL